jgi:hypothetical protein
MSKNCIAGKYCPPAGMTWSVTNLSKSPHKSVSMGMYGESCQFNFIFVNISSVRTCNSNRKFFKVPKNGLSFKKTLVHGVNYTCQSKFFTQGFIGTIPITTIMYVIFKIGSAYNWLCIIGLIPVAARSRAWFCGRSLFGITGSNPDGVMDICLSCVLCCQVEISATG